MDFNTAPIRDFLWESYGIYTTTEFLKSVQDCSQNEKKERFINHSLDNLLLYRVKHDPGFHLFVRDKVHSDFLLQERVCHIVLYLFGETSKLFSFKGEVLAPKGLTEIMMRAEKEGKNPLEEALVFSQESSEIQHYMAERAIQERDAKVKYLQARLEEAVEHMDNELEMIAIRQQMLDHGTGKYFGHVLAADDLLFPAAGLTENIQHAANSFVFSNLKFRGLYLPDSKNKAQDAFLHTCIPWIMPYESLLENVIFGKSTSTAGDEWKNVLDLWKFEADVSTIATYEWFLTLSSQEKISFLNGDYHFQLRDDLLQMMAKSDTESFDVMTFRMNHLFRANYFEHAAKMGEFLFKAQKKGNNKYFIASSIATYYREYEDYHNAMKWYGIAKKLTKKLDPASKIHKEFIEWKNCAEMGYYIHGSEHFRKEIDHIIRDSQKLPVLLRSVVVYNIAEACRRTGHYNMEYDHLTDFIDLADPNEPQFAESFEAALQRIGMYNQLPSADYTKIREYDNSQIEKVYHRRCRASSLSFQYEDGMHWIDCLIKLNPQAYQYQEKAVLYRHIGENDKAISFYRIAAEKATDNRNKSFCLISIALLEAKKSGSVNANIQDMITSALSSLPNMGKMDAEPDVYAILNPIIYEIVGWSDTSLKYQFLDALVRSYQKGGLTDNICLSIGTVFFSHSLCSDAREWFERALSSADLESEEARIMSLIADTFFAEGNSETAGKWFKQAHQKNSESAECLAGVARCHTALMEYDLAEGAIRQARLIDPNNTDYRKMEEEIKTLASHVISLKRIESVEVKKIFRTGDWLLFSVFNAQERDEYDIGPVVIQYGKGVEKMLYDVILRPIRETMRRNTSYIMPDGGVKKELWNGSKSIARLPPSLKSVFGKREKSLALGQWEHLMKDIGKAKTNPVASCFGKMLAENGFDESKLNKIGRLCSDLSYERNGAAHISFYTREEVQEKRGEMVTIINAIIGLVPQRVGNDSS
ncbi:tetratricopeptide repeat protein [Methanogenium organophilum]|uniref:Tetratricopeptide repeat protein n=1 Tax=Methanogenium organophilum TaxID=2199 RepID=A0A9X9S4W1_METOG|nr:tetratricopeptide repeat protein [Methanogenium organophilum]WAI00950.1 tetratricopeptide repeat protein [Methanogenium organophilum]